MGCWPVFVIGMIAGLIVYGLLISFLFDSDSCKRCVKARDAACAKCGDGYGAPSHNDRNWASHEFVSGRGIAAGASGLQPDDASSTLAVRSKIGSLVGRYRAGEITAVQLFDVLVDAGCPPAEAAVIVSAARML